MMSSSVVTICKQCELQGKLLLQFPWSVYCKESCYNPHGVFIARKVLTVCLFLQFSCSVYCKKSLTICLLLQSSCSLYCKKSLTICLLLHTVCIARNVLTVCLLQSLCSVYSKESCYNPHGVFIARNVLTVCLLQSSCSVYCKKGFDHLLDVTIHMQCVLQEFIYSFEIQKCCIVGSAF